MKDERIAADALEFWLNKTRMAQAELAEKAGLAQNYISQIKSGARGAPSIKALQKIAEALGLSLLEFLACKDESLPDIECVPLVKAVPRAGSGGLETDGEHLQMYSFHSKFLQRKGGNKETMRLFKIDGDSMEPTLFSGDMIMVNTTDAARHIFTSNIYLLRLGIGDESELMVKRLERRPGNILMIRSDNDRYEDIPVSLDDMGKEAEIFGRMVWSCREY